MACMRAGRILAGTSSSEAKKSKFSRAESRGKNDRSLASAKPTCLRTVPALKQVSAPSLKLISTMLLPDSGRVLIEGADTCLRAGTVRKHVGFAVANERSFFPRLSARENLDFFASLENVPAKIRPVRIQAMLERTGLQDAANTLVMKFSSGMYQRLGIARALIKQPSV